MFLLFLILLLIIIFLITSVCLWLILPLPLGDCQMSHVQVHYENSDATNLAEKKEEQLWMKIYKKIVHHVHKYIPHQNI